jgi:hypothetical protein
MTRPCALITFFGLFAGLAFADDALPKAETILDHFIEVTGGKVAYEKRTSETMTGTVEISAQNLTGKLTAYSAPPDKAYRMMEIDGVGKFEEGATGGVAWSNDPINGPRLKSGEEKAQSLREALFNGQVNWRQMYAKAEMAGVESIDGEECYKVMLTPADGKPETMYYQKKSGLAVKMTTVASSPMGEFPVEQVLSGYKDFDGVKMPTKMVEKTAGQEIVITIQTVQINQDIPADRFNPPAAIKTLLEKK